MHGQSYHNHRRSLGYSFYHSTMPDPNQAGPVESQATPNQVQIVDSVVGITAKQGLGFWERLYLDDLIEGAIYSVAVAGEVSLNEADAAMFKKGKHKIG